MISALTVTRGDKYIDECFKTDWANECATHSPIVVVQLCMLNGQLCHFEYILLKSKISC